ncbi:biogenesis of lysosome-related organelles complex 1 subunit 4 isoform X2 [Pseudomyrmex gracilis]|uniref:biogenesis of lysosome-related organelles complex 1 subunit 4 isoform X2 n=1 Tax=Pseudomyrmex gracilis TaxID=219809 RepID=UPI0009949FC8|nr:biogenesis of lysosome-related organelles complex 1 subunit 4 isoform X2 [Pseudomyrmex gracilis]XP_020294368.1 biogenesis of lysosome-related organelles complex 1 subunit 4 isoform X2 [Pseudomyrmex gracilis]
MVLTQKWTGIIRQMKNFRDIIEDTLIRLEEFQSIVSMVESGSSECMQQHLPKLQHMKDSMTSLRRRIDALEHVVAMANMNLSTLEAAVDKAEAELGISDRLFGMLNPLLFFKKTQEPVASNTVPMYKSPMIYRSDDYFQRE